MSPRGYILGLPIESGFYDPEPTWDSHFRTEGDTEIFGDFVAMPWALGDEHICPHCHQTIAVITDGPRGLRLEKINPGCLD